ncbi:TPA_asm: coat protein [ssRNA phage SRR7976323_3]|uniref:Coat protein n=1 Tax=ssRNA phage SRR7976323_3 TaxID=2786690 RepID=A0A8S5L5W4_9VIRU|nr:coat protein [ssRNA phage SRR7976323_3]DAD52738.1 TPA_asm: coat protein [ssRNA phage SRR7976323_3]
MPQASAIVINDGAATPVAHTFSPIGKDDKGVLWFEQTTPAPATPMAAKRISYTQSRVLAPDKQLTGSSRIVYVLWVPTLETLGNNSAGILPPPTLAYVEKVRVEYNLAERSTWQERKDTRVLSLNLLGHAMAVFNVDALQPSYA